MATLGLPNHPSYFPNSPLDRDQQQQIKSDTTSATNPATSKFPHTRAQLAAIARQRKPVADNIEPETDSEELNRIPTSLVNKVVSLLVDENEDELKALLKETFDVDHETVSIIFFSLVVVYTRHLIYIDI